MSDWCALFASTESSRHDLPWQNGTIPVIVVIPVKHWECFIVGLAPIVVDAGMSDYRPSSLLPVLNVQKHQMGPIIRAIPVIVVYAILPVPVPVWIKDDGLPMLRLLVKVPFRTPFIVARTAMGHCEYRYRYQYSSPLFYVCISLSMVSLDG